jgi:hypothetical protein
MRYTVVQQRQKYVLRCVIVYSVLEKCYGERLWLVGKCIRCDSSDTKNLYLQDCARARARVCVCVCVCVYIYIHTHT